LEEYELFQKNIIKRIKQQKIKKKKKKKKIEKKKVIMQ
jgi:hypothetical protein